MLTTSDWMMQTYQNGNRGTELRRSAAQIFRNEQLHGWFHRLAACLRGDCSQLVALHSVLRNRRVRSSHYAGTQTVAIERICGTESKTQDFDRYFHPIHGRMISRWIGVFVARLNGKCLPAVELIEVGGEYFVRDGHHRISVAHALGEGFIDAEVTVWEVAR